MSELTSVEEENVKNVYENIADRFNSTRLYTWTWIDEFLENHDENAIVYDIGCGNGRNMMNNKFKFIGIDNCNNFIKICNQKILKLLIVILLIYH